MIVAGERGDHVNTSKKEHENLMQIGEIAQLTGLNIQSLRYYERRKILKPTKKKSSGYRLYDKQSVRTLKFIKNAQELGFSLSEIEELLKLRVTSPSRASKVRERAAEKFSAPICKFVIVLSKRFCIAPNSERKVLTC